MDIQVVSYDNYSRSKHYDRQDPDMLHYKLDHREICTKYRGDVIKQTVNEDQWKPQHREAKIADELPVECFHAVSDNSGKVNAIGGR